MIRQGTDEWHEARLGRVTSSRFNDVLNSGKGFTKTNLSYIYQLVGERLSGRWETISSKPMDWGTQWEPYAREYLERIFEIEVEEMPFMPHPKMMAGGSPDGFIKSTNQIIEIKCPYTTRVHVSTLLKQEVPKEYMPQVQGNIWLSGCEGAKFISFDPRIDSKNNLVVLDVPRDDEYISNLSVKVEEACSEVSRIYDKLSKMAAGSKIIEA